MKNIISYPVTSSFFKLQVSYFFFFNYCTVFSFICKNLVNHFQHIRYGNKQTDMFLPQDFSLRDIKIVYDKMFTIFMERINTQVSCVISNPISAHSLKTKKKCFS